MKCDAVQTWINNVAYSHSKSEETEKSYRHSMSRFCDFIGCTPQEILEQYEGLTERQFKRKYARYLRSFISELSANGYAMGTIDTRVIAVRSFFKYNDLPLGYVPVGRMRITFHNRDVAREEVQKVLEISRVRDQGFFCMMAQSGLRPGTLCSLRLKHVEPEFSKGIIPPKIEVPEELAKGAFGAYFTFMGEESVKYLKAYLATRPGIGPEDYLFSLHGKNSRANPKSFSRIFARTIQMLREKGIMEYEESPHGKPNEVRLYNLRKFFRKYATPAGIEYVNFWMGHKTNYKAPHIPASDEHYFSREDVEFQRQLYKESAMPYLRLETATPSETEQTIMELRKQLTERDREITKLNQKIEELGGVKRLADAMERSKTLDEAFVRFKRLKDREFETR